MTTEEIVSAIMALDKAELSMITDAISDRLDKEFSVTVSETETVETPEGEATVATETVTEPTRVMPIF